MIVSKQLVVLALTCFFSRATLAQRVVRVSEPDAINPAEVSVAINPANPENIAAASFQTGIAPRPRAGSYNYVSVDGGKTWKTIAADDPKGLAQGDDAVYFGAE